jgi:hypothetical protein
VLVMACARRQCACATQSTVAMPATSQRLVIALDDTAFIGEYLHVCVFSLRIVLTDVCAGNPCSQPHTVCVGRNGTAAVCVCAVGYSGSATIGCTSSSAFYVVGSWSSCDSVACGTLANQTRTVICKSSAGVLRSFFAFTHMLVVCDAWFALAHARRDGGCFELWQPCATKLASLPRNHVWRCVRLWVWFHSDFQAHLHLLWLYFSVDTSQLTSVSLQLQASFASFLGSFDVMSSVTSNLLAEIATATSISVSRLSFVSLTANGLFTFYIIPGDHGFATSTNDVSLSLLAAVRTLACLAL